MAHTVSVELAAMTNIATRVEPLHIEDFIRAQIVHTALDTQYLRQQLHNFALLVTLSEELIVPVVVLVMTNIVTRRVRGTNIIIIQVLHAHIAHSNTKLHASNYSFFHKKTPHMMRGSCIFN